MKKAAIIVPVFLVVLLAVLLIAPGFVDWNSYKTQAQEQIQKHSGYHVALNGDLGLSLLPAPYLFVENVEVAAPAPSKVAQLATLKRMEISLAVLPLLGGTIDVRSVNLVEPMIALEVLKSGEGNWMTPELKAMTEGDADAGKPKNNGAGIALQSVSIEKGKLSYIPAADAAPVEIGDINLNLRAVSLKGPFEAKGSVLYAGQTIDVQARSDVAPDDMSALSVNIKAAAQPAGVQLDYAGIAGLQAPYELQGETRLNIASLSSTLKSFGVTAPPPVESLRLEGLLTASETAIDLRNAVVKLGDAEMTGFVGAGLKPMSIKAALKSKAPLNLDQMMAKAPAAQPAQGGGTLTGFLPQSVTLPKDFNIDVALEAPGVTYQSQMYQQVALSLKNEGSKAFALQVSAGDIPGKGNAEVKASLGFAEKARAADGSDIYADPFLSAEVDANSQNIPKTLQAITGMNNLALPAAWKTGAITARAKVAADAIDITDARLRVADTSAQMSGRFAQGKKGGRAKLTVDAAVDTLNLDTLSEKKESGGGADDFAATLKALSLPYDLAFDIGVQSLQMQGQAIKGLRAQGNLQADSLMFSNLSAQDYAGAALKLEGGIGSLKALSGIDLRVAGQSADLPRFAKALQIDPASLPDNLDRASANITAKGNADKLAVNASVQALNGEVIARGDVAAPLASWSLSGLAVQIKHRNLAEALAMFAPSAPRYASWQKPMDLSANVTQQGQVYKLTDIKGNLAGATVGGDVTMNAGGAKPDLQANLTFGDLVMTSAATSSAAGVQQVRPSGSGGGKWSSAPIDSGWMHGMNMALTIAANTITYESWYLQKPSLKMTLKDGTLNIADLKSTLFGGALALSGTATSAAQGKGALSIDANTQFDNVSMEKLVQGLVGVPILQASGDVSLNGSFKTTGASQSALINALSGQGTVTGKSLTLEGIDVTRFVTALSDETKPGDTLQGLWKGATRGGSTSFETLDGNYNIARGVVNIAKMDLDGPQAAIATTGTVNLPAWTISTAHKMTAKTKTDVPPFTINISGPLDNPGQTFAQGAINDYLGRKLQRKIGNELDKLLGKKLGLPPAQPQDVTPSGGEPGSAPAPQPQQGTTPEDAIKDVLKGILSR